MNARKLLLSLTLFIVLLALPVAGRYAFYYAGAADRPQVARPALDEVQIPTPPAEQYLDVQVEAGDGVVLVDMAHDNQFQLPELNVLAGRLASRGHQLQSWTAGDPAELLQDASALLVAAPLVSYDKDELDAVDDFVESGGRLLLIGDPTRYGFQFDEMGWVDQIDSDARYLNELGGRYGITFVDDYLYNVSENEGNFRNIRLTEWVDDPLTDELESVVFYAAHSLAVADDAALIRAGDDTWSSATDRAGGLVVAARAAGGNVLALGDLTFMTEPYHTVRDNSRLIAHVADFLTTGRRSYTLADFPRFLGKKVALVFTNQLELGPGQLALVDGLEETLQATGRRLVLTDASDNKTDTISVGIYSQAEPISKTLAGYGVTLVYTPTESLSGEDVTSEDVGDEASVEDDAPAEDEAEDVLDEAPAAEAEGLVRIEGLGSYSMSGIALVLYDSQGGDGRQVLTVLAASQEGMGRTLLRLPDGDLDDCVQADMLILCPTNISHEAIEESWLPIEFEVTADDRPVAGDGGDQDALPAGYEGRLELGDSASGELPAGEAHRWLFSAAAGDVVTIRVESSNSEVDLVLELAGPDGETLISIDDTLSDEPEEIADFVLPDDGDYTIRVQDFWEVGGFYTISLLAGSEKDDTAADAGTIAMGETIEGSLAENEEAVWTFSGEADQAITILLQPSSEADLTLILQTGEGDVLTSSDSGFAGEQEQIEGRLPADGTYQIVVSEYYGEPASYTLSLEQGGEGGVLGGWGILIVAADDGTPMAEGRTSAQLLMDLLAPEYDVTLWTNSQDGIITAEDMLDYQLVIWTSGDFQGGDQEGLFGYLFSGGALMLSGAYPSLADGEETALLRDLEVGSGDSILTTGFAPGQVIQLANEIDAVVFDLGDDDEETIPVFLRGPDSEQAGDMIAAALDSADSYGLKALVIGFPIYLLPEDAQAQFVSNAVSWFGITPQP